jgi:hypothetical protein
MAGTETAASAGTIEPRVKAARIALARGDGIAAAYLIADAEKKAAAMNVAQLAPLAERHVSSSKGLRAAQEARMANADARWGERLAILDRLDRAIRGPIKYDERWTRLAEDFLAEEGETLQVEAAKKRLPAWRKSSGR